jgi:hypothetical protein
MYSSLQKGQVGKFPLQPKLTSSLGYTKNHSLGENSNQWRCWDMEKTSFSRKTLIRYRETPTRRTYSLGKTPALDYSPVARICAIQNTLFFRSQPMFYSTNTLGKIPTIICHMPRFEHGSIPWPSTHKTITRNYKITKIVNYTVHFTFGSESL